MQQSAASPTPSDWSRWLDEAGFALLVLTASIHGTDNRSIHELQPLRDESPLRARLNVPTNDRYDMLWSLRVLGITHATMFPDLEVRPGPDGPVPPAVGRELDRYLRSRSDHGHVTPGDILDGRP